MVCASLGVRLLGTPLHMQRSNRQPAVAVVLCTLNRPQELETCLTSLQQTNHVIQIILLTQRGPLATLRNQGLAAVKAPLVCFCDDDIVASPGYLDRIIKFFARHPSITGLTGPSIIPPTYRSHRALYRYPRLRHWYDRWFVAPETRPGYLTPGGTFHPDPDRSYRGPVQFLEACHQTYRTEAVRAVGGFDEAYAGIGDWSEPDLGYRLAPKLLWHDPQLTVEHRCSPSGATAIRRADAAQRLRNYRLFARRWVPPSLRNWWYQRFLEGYYGWHTLKP